ncbi:MarR family transcriptional regulator [Myceligenerans cantabricum]
MVPEQVPDEPVEPSMLDPRVLDPDQEIVRRSDLQDHDVDQVVRLLEGLRRWRETERRLQEASRRHMGLGETDMQTLQFIITLQTQGRLATPGAIAAHLGISSASTTKLLDRLAADNHLRRLPHPADRRSLAIEVTEETARAAHLAVDRSHAHRFAAAARLNPREREIVVRFLDDLAATDEEP